MEKKTASVKFPIDHENCYGCFFNISMMVVYPKGRNKIELDKCHKRKSEIFPPRMSPFDLPFISARSMAVSPGVLIWGSAPFCINSFTTSSWPTKKFWKNVIAKNSVYWKIHHFKYLLQLHNVRHTVHDCLWYLFLLHVESTFEQYSHALEILYKIPRCECIWRNKQKCRTNV